MSMTFGSHPWAFSHAGCVLPFCPHVSLYNAPGLFSYPDTCSLIDSQRDLYITHRQLTRAGQWCVSCFWLRLCVLNSHGPPVGQHKADGVWERCCWSVQPTAGLAWPCFFFFSFLPQRRAEEKKGRKTKMRVRPCQCVEMWLMCQRIPPTTQTPHCWIEGRLWQTLTSKLRHAAEEINDRQQKNRLMVQNENTTYKLIKKKKKFYSYFLNLLLFHFTPAVIINLSLSSLHPAFCNFHKKTLYHFIWW